MKPQNIFAGRSSYNDIYSSCSYLKKNPQVRTSEQFKRATKRPFVGKRVLDHSFVILTPSHPIGVLLLSCCACRQDGSYYVGNWSSDSQHGSGVMITSNGVRQPCAWERGKRVKVRFQEADEGALIHPGALF
eukprot:3441575-Amphidinium_carterae.1